MNITKYGESIKYIADKRKAIDELYNSITQMEDFITDTKRNALNAIDNEKLNLKERLKFLKATTKEIKRA